MALLSTGPRILKQEQGAGCSGVRVIMCGRISLAVAAGTWGSTQGGGRGRRKIFFLVKNNFKEG